MINKKWIMEALEECKSDIQNGELVSHEEVLIEWQAKVMNQHDNWQPDRRIGMNYHIEYELETDGRWLAEVPEIPGVMTYGSTADEAMAKAETLALRVLADRIETGENRPMSISIELVAA